MSKTNGWRPKLNSTLSSFPSMPTVGKRGIRGKVTLLMSGERTVANRLAEREEDSALQVVDAAANHVAFPHRLSTLSNCLVHVDVPCLLAADRKRGLFGESGKLVQGQRSVAESDDKIAR